MKLKIAAILGTSSAILLAGCLGEIGDRGSAIDQPGSAGNGQGSTDLGAGGAASTPSGEGGAVLPDPPADDPPADDPPDDPPADDPPDDPPAPVVDCSGIAQHAAYELCDAGADHCAGVFTNGAGCAAFCAAAGLECTARYGGEPGCQKEATPLDCHANNGHLSDWCVCGPSDSPPSTCPTDPQSPPALVEQHYTQASFNPRSSWVLTCQSYAYTAQYSEHETCDPLYSAGSGKGIATFSLNVNPGQYDVFVEGRHTANRNPAGMRVEVHSGGESYVAYIMQRDSSGALQLDLHGTYCLSGQVEIIIDSAVSSASDSVARVRLQPS